MQLACAACGTLIPAEDINIDKAIAKCRNCNGVFSFYEHLKTAEEHRPRPPVPMPRGLRVENWGPELTITRRWYTHGLWFLLLFCVFWDGFLVVWYTIGIGELQKPNADWSIWIMLVFPVFHLLIGLALTVAVVYGFLNRTVIRVSMGELSVFHGPIPCGGNRRVRGIDLKQLYCTETNRKSKNGISTHYNLIALQRDGTKLTLLSALDDLNQALYIEQQIEQCLKIPDERVPDEVPV